MKYRQALHAASVLAFRPFEFVALNEMVDACSGSWLVQTWYRRLIEDVPRRDLEHLRELTRRSLDMDALAKMPEGSFGRRYATFCEENKIRAMGHVDAVPGLKETFARDWVTHRFFKIHDILHCVVGFGVDNVASEMGLQMFDLVNLREPYGIGAVASTPYMMLRYGQPLKMLKELVRGYQLGNKTGNLFFAPFEEMWELPFEEVRRRLGFVAKDSVGQG